MKQTLGSMDFLRDVDFRPETNAMIKVLLDNDVIFNFDRHPPVRRETENSRTRTRTRSRSRIWRQALQAQPNLPSPEESGWKQTCNGTLKIDLCDGQILPSEIVDKYIYI